MGWNLSASAGGSGPGALMLVVGAILVVISLACFKGAEFLASLGAEVGNFGCFLLGLLGVGLIIAAVVYFFRS